MAASLGTSRRVALLRPALAVDAHIHAYVAHGCGVTVARHTTAGAAPLGQVCRSSARCKASSRQSKRGLTISTATPGPASPWYEDFRREATLAIPREVAYAAPPVIPRASSANDPNHGYTWLTHPCPTNPFRTRADEDMWYVEPTLEQRQLAMTLGLPLHGIY